MLFLNKNNYDVFYLVVVLVAALSGVHGYSGGPPPGKTNIFDL